MATLYWAKATFRSFHFNQRNNSSLHNWVKHYTISFFGKAETWHSVTAWWIIRFPRGKIWRAHRQQQFFDTIRKWQFFSMKQIFVDSAVKHSGIWNLDSTVEHISHVCYSIISSSTSQPIFLKNFVCSLCKFRNLSNFRSLKTVKQCCQLF